MIRETFIETENVTSFRKAINELVKRQRLQPGFLVVEGESGRGKTMAADNWYAVNGGIYFRVWEGLSQRAFLQELAFECTKFRPHTSHNCKRVIIDKLKAEPRAIIVDEADRLHLSRIEDLRDINEASGAAIVLIGETGLMGMLNAKQRIYSRVAEVVNFQPISPGDVVIYGAQMADLSIHPEAADLLTRKSGGSFRMIHNYMVKISQMARANGLANIELSHVESLKLRDSEWRA